MISKEITQAHFAVIQEAVHQLYKFSERAAEPAPHYHSFLRTLSNSVLPMLGVTMVLAAGGNFKAQCKVTGAAFDFEIPDDEIFKHTVDLLHRAFYNNLGIVLEALCKGYCEARGKEVPSRHAPRPPEFIEYMNAALNASTLGEDRKNHWRKYFMAIRVLRNKSSHYSTALTPNEKQILMEAGLNHHIGGDHMQSNPIFYAPLAHTALDFARELEKK
jgi:hypothetical protein